MNGWRSDSVSVGWLSKFKTSPPDVLVSFKPQRAKRRKFRRTAQAITAHVSARRPNNRRAAHMIPLPSTRYAIDDSAVARPTYQAVVRPAGRGTGPCGRNGEGSGAGRRDRDCEQSLFLSMRGHCASWQQPAQRVAQPFAILAASSPPAAARRPERSTTRAPRNPTPVPALPPAGSVAPG